MTTIVKLTKEQLEAKAQFIDEYVKANNAADGSAVDANANVSNKNIATLMAELHKDFNVQLKRYMVTRKIEVLFGKELADEYNRQIEAHEIYVHDESGLAPYCVSITMYPFLLNGLKDLGGESVAPQHLASFCGSFINLIFAISSQFCGAVASVEFLNVFDYFARKDYGDNYLENYPNLIKNYFQQVVYSINQPASARGYQCVRADTTQLFTPNGFKYRHELNEGDECYVWKNGKIAIEKIKKLNDYDFDGELLQFKGRNYQQTVTPNHRVLYKIPNTNEYAIKEAKDVFGKTKISMPICADNDFEDFQITDDMLILCAAVLCDGSILPEESKDSRISIYLSKDRWGYKNLPAILDRNGIGYKLTDNTTNSFGEMARLVINSLDAQIILRQLKHTKKALPHWVNLLSKRQAKLFINTWSKFDGTNSFNREHKVSKNTVDCFKDNFDLQADNEQIADALQHVCLRAGYGSKKYIKQFNKVNSQELSEKSTFYVKTFKRPDKRVSEYNKIKYTGKVWCPTTDAGVVIFREENNIPYISGNSVFWNISIFDKPYFESIFGDFRFPDGEAPKYETLSKLQAFFMDWFNEERRRALLTFPVVTAAILTDGKEPIDKEFLDMCAEQDSKGNSFFKYMSDSADSLASCCRLRNALQDNTFSYSLGAGGVSTGSLNVITLNANRFIQNCVKSDKDIFVELKEQIKKIHKYQLATRAYLEDYLKADMLPVYKAGYINMKKQFLTVGINGVVDGAEFLGYEVTNNKEYKEFTSKFLNTIYTTNNEGKKEFGVLFNTEFVPAENLGCKNYKWDKKDGYVVNPKRNCYNSYLYPVEDDAVDIVDKFIIHGKENLQYLDGGSALHLNLEEYPTKEGYKKLYKLAAETGCNYWTTNIKVTCCEDCGNIDKRTLNACPKCGSKNITYATRIIGYLKKISSFSSERQKEEEMRFYHKEGKGDK